MQKRPSAVEMFVVRVGDTEREAVLDALGEHHARGRLSVEELDRRQEAALVAVTHADLAALLADLPPIDQRLLLSRLRRTPALGWLPDRRRTLKWAGPPAVLVAGSVYMASQQPFDNDPSQFGTALAMGALGYVSHWWASRIQD